MAWRASARADGLQVNMVDMHAYRPRWCRVVASGGNTSCDSMFICVVLLIVSVRSCPFILFLQQSARVRFVEGAQSPTGRRPGDRAGRREVVLGRQRGLALTPS